MLRAVAAGVVCLVSGWQAGLRLTQRAEQLQAWQQAIDSMHTYCGCLRLSPDEIIARSTAHMSASVREEAHLLTPLEQTLIKACYHVVFNGTQEEQLRQLDFARLRLQHYAENAAEKSRRDARLYTLLGVFGGMCAFLVCL